jgi:site-specific DNA-methyltransferase (adenine-specific)
MIQTNYNPDVLTCLANLSNDEVFTPPTLVNDILDLLPQELWSNPNATFLDPVTKSGVFLREIAKRLMKGLETQIPDKQDRINHIFSKQLYGIAITELTSLLSRRSVYCSKTANGKYSICETFTNEQGNIHYKRMQHTWQGGKCTYCGASQEVYDRDDALETYAYNFIHTENPGKIFNMKFDVIIGNPPYQLSTAGEENGAQAKPLYHLFIEQAKKLNPGYLIMITPSRWFAGGWGLDEFRNNMLTDKSIKELHDFPVATDCFPGVDIKGGVSYFIWEKSHNSKTKFVTHIGGEIVSCLERFLQEPNCDILIRYNEAIPILQKVRSLNESTFEFLVSTKKPFGFTTNYKGSKTKTPTSIKLYANRRIEYVERAKVERRSEAVNMHKIIVPKAVGSGDSKTDIIKPLYCEPGACCTETYLLIGPFESKKQCDNVMSYINTRFFHFMVTLQKNTQDCMKKVYSFVPIQDFGQSWTDEKLYNKYKLTKDEILFIESMVHPNSANETAEADE